MVGDAVEQHGGDRWDHQRARLDILSANRLGYALYPEVSVNPERPANLDYEALGLTADIGLTLVVYTAEPGSPSQAALNRLASRGSPPPGVTTLGTNREDDDIVHQPRRR